MDSPVVYLNGRIIPASQALVSVWDAGFLHGASAFTTMLARNGKVFRLDRHLARLLDAVRTLRLRVEVTAEDLALAVAEVLRANVLRDAQVRVTLTPGDVRSGEPTRLVTAAPLPEYPAQWYSGGVTVAVAPYKQSGFDPIYGNKTGSYVSRMLARQDAAARGADEALWFTVENYLAEACFCNVFLVREGKVHTPPLNTPVLAGIVRQAVLELCGTLGIDCDDQTRLTVREMLAADEIFLTSSLSGVRPVVRVERHGVGVEKPGEITRRILAAYHDLVQRECA